MASLIIFNELEEELMRFRNLYRSFYSGGKIYDRGSLEELQQSLTALGYEIPSSILIPAKILLKDNEAPIIEHASDKSLLSPKKANFVDIKQPKTITRRPVDEPVFLEFLGCLEKIEKPGQNTPVWRYIFKKTPLQFAGQPPR